MKLAVLFILLVVLASAIAVVKKTYFPDPSTTVEISFWVAETILVFILFVTYVKKMGLRLNNV